MGPRILTRIADEVGTPAYVYDAATIRSRYERLRRALDGIPHRIHYSVKANSNLAVLHLLQSLGAGADIVSAGELARVAAAGFAPERIVFSGAGKRADELAAAVTAGVGLVNVESAAEVDLLADVARRGGWRVDVGVRVNPDVTADTHPYTRTAGRGIKFGVPVDQARGVALRVHARRELTLRSLGVHIGSQVADPAPYATAAGTLETLIRAIRAEGVDTIESVDLGGGYAVRYRDGGEELEPQRFVDAVRPAVERMGLTLLVEPGRSLVAEAGSLLTRVLYRKHSGGREITVVDAGMNDLMRPSLYGAEHTIDVVEPRKTAGVDPADAVPVDVVGPLCETGDFLGLGRTLAGAAPGALLAVRAVGAYGFCMSSHYNSRPRAAEVMVDGERWAIIRARETMDDLMRGETVVTAWRS